MKGKGGNVDESMDHLPQSHSTNKALNKGFEGLLGPRTSSDRDDSGLSGEAEDTSSHKRFQQATEDDFIGEVHPSQLGVKCEDVNQGAVSSFV